MTDDDIGEPKFLHDWTMEQNGKAIRLRWCDEDGVHAAELPRWLMDVLCNRFKERSIDG